MILKKETILYHGSYALVEKIDLAKCEDMKDFGKGFYLTSSESQARSFISTSLIKAKKKGIILEDAKIGYISKFKLIADINVPIYYFDDQIDKIWLYYVAINRRNTLEEQLRKYVPSEIFSSEIIAGKIANDNTNAVLNLFLSGAYGEFDDINAVDTAIRLLLPNKLKDQYCFKTEKAITLLKFVSGEKYEA